MSFEPVIGLEIHAQLLTKSKMFCRCPNIYGEKPNTIICPICTGQPGVLPILNREAVFLGVKTALAFGCDIKEISIFERKNYFYPDLPKSYQISQYERPFSVGGAIIVVDESGKEKKVALERIHFEEDAGKLIHVGQETKIDFNRAGVPLIEIVTKPVIHSPQMASLTLKWLKYTLQFLGISDCKMEQGSFRCDANISVRHKNDKKLGAKVELKNINSFKFIERALQYEIDRQIEILKKGEKITRETRLWNIHKNITEVMREKEEADDYRYFPEPDLKPLVINSEFVESVFKGMPELPIALYRKLTNFGLTHNFAIEIISSPSMISYYFDALNVTNEPIKTANWLLNELIGLINKENIDISNCPLKAREFGRFVKLICENKITANTAKHFLKEMIHTGKSLSELKISTYSSEEEIMELANNVLAKFPDEVAKYKSGKKALLGFFIGEVMKISSGKGDPILIKEALVKLLD